MIKIATIAITARIIKISNQIAILKYKVEAITVKIANIINGKVSNVLSATTVANASCIGYFPSLDKIYALTGSPPPRPEGVILFTARPTKVIGSNFLKLISISAKLLRICQRRVYKTKTTTCTPTANNNNPALAIFNAAITSFIPTNPNITASIRILIPRKNIDFLSIVSILSFSILINIYRNMFNK